MPRIIQIAAARRGRGHNAETDVYGIDEEGNLYMLDNSCASMDGPRWLLWVSHDKPRTKL